MTAVGKCANCGGEIPGDARTMGLCPKCLISRVRLSHVKVRQGSHPAGPNSGGSESSHLAAAVPDFEILNVIGQGGMGVVYRARHRSTGALVALKAMRIDSAADPAMLERFAGEARILESLTHPHIVRACNCSRSGDYLYIVLELINGPSLRQVLRQVPLPVRESMMVGLQICNALAYAHGRGVIHRDIKPENILLRPGEGATVRPGLEGFFEEGGRAMLVDFGLARGHASDSLALSLTMPNHRMGTLDYMAPESRNTNAAVDARADLYAVGVVLYEMVTGMLPLGYFRPPSEICQTSAEVDRIIIGCLQTRPDDRYSDAGLLRTHLSAALGLGATAPQEPRRATGKLPFGLHRLFSRSEP